MWRLCGAGEDHVARVASQRLPQGDARSAERSALDVAQALASVPSSLTEVQRTALRRSFSRPDADWIVLAVAIMGFLNKFMDAMGIPLEESMLATAQKATAVEDEALANSARTLARQAGATSAQLNGSREGISKQADAALGLTQAAASSPAQITPDLVAATTAELSPPAIIELMVWISVMQIMHRLQAFYC